MMHFSFLVDVMLSGFFFVLFLLIFSFKIVIFYDAYDDDDAYSLAVSSGFHCCISRGV
jgi:hypothetical protein